MEYIKNKNGKVWKLEAYDATMLAYSDDESEFATTNYWTEESAEKAAKEWADDLAPRLAEGERVTIRVIYDLLMIDGDLMDEESYDLEWYVVTNGKVTDNTAPSNEEEGG